MVFPDTSPRGAGVDGEDKDWDFGTGESSRLQSSNPRSCDHTGAGFYLNATSDAYSKSYNM